MADDSDKPEASSSEDKRPPGEADLQVQDDVRATVELPAVVLGEEQVQAVRPMRRLLPGIVDLRWAVYPAYVLCFIAGGIAVNVAIDGREWAAGPVALAWSLLFLWEWVYAVAYRYRRTLLKYFSGLMVLVVGGLLTLLVWERGQPQLVATLQGLVERPAVRSLSLAAFCTAMSAALVVLHLAALGRGYREKRRRGRRRA